MSQDVLIFVASVLVIGGAAQWLAWRFSLPSILLLLIFGFLAGPVFGLIQPDAVLGSLLLPLVSVSVALILFEGGLSLKLSELPKVGGVVRNLTTIGALTTWLVGALAARFIFAMPIGLALLLGAVLVVTGPTVIGPLLRLIRPTGNVGAVLKWEGIVIDPIGALLAVLLFEVLPMGEVSDIAAHIGVGLLKTLVVGGGAGLFAAYMLTLFLKRYWIPEFLQNAVSSTLVIAVFTACNAIQHESGLLAVTVMGIALANQKLADVKHIVEFKENLRILLISFLFILLAARLQFADLATMGLGGLLFVAALILVARPLTVLVSTRDASLNIRERIFLACMAPRGIVAAAIASIFALRLEAAGYADARLIVPITFATIIGTVAIYGLVSLPLARRLGLADANPQGVLMLGAHPWARAMASVLKEKGFRVLLIDSNRTNIAAARLEGLPTYSGSILAEYALDEMDLGGIGRLLALTPNEWINTLAVQRFLRIFGVNECYQLSPRGEESRKRTHHKHIQGRWLFDAKMDYATIRQRFDEGYVVKATPLTESFDFAAFRELYRERFIPLFLIAESGKLAVLADEEQPEPPPGQTLVSLVRE